MTDPLEPIAAHGYRNTTLLTYYNTFLQHLLSSYPPDPTSQESSQSESSLTPEGEGITIASTGVEIKLNRTLRVPDDDEKYCLPPVCFWFIGFIPSGRL